MIKSVLAFTSAPVHFHIFCDNSSRSQLEDNPDLQLVPFQLKPLRLNSRRRKDLFKFYPISTSVSNISLLSLQRMYKGICATQRLFFPTLLPNVSRTLYVDTDTVFLVDVANIWSRFDDFGDATMAAFAPEHEDPNMAWYGRFAMHPFYGSLGLNSGVMLMDLDRMRQFGWSHRVVQTYHQYLDKLVWGDQDLINIIFHFHPDKALQLNCEYNYRPDHCIYGNNCESSKNPVRLFVLHGSRNSFHNDKHPVHRAFYNAFLKYDLTKRATVFWRLVESELNQLNPSKDVDCLRFAWTVFDKWRNELGMGGRRVRKTNV